MKPILVHGPPLRAELNHWIRARQSKANDELAWEADFLKRLAPYATSGKLLRGSLVCYAYELFAAKAATESITKAAMAMELVHSALLIHDDIMDQDDIRRGQPAMHIQYQREAERRGLAKAEHFGVSMAICGADSTLFMAFDLLAEAQTKTAIAPPARYLLFRQLSTVCAGQMQDIYLQVSPAQPTKQAIYRLMHAKTASYTITLPLLMGAVFAGASMRTLKQLEIIGKAAGSIFQIRDDQLGILGESSATGKPVGSDIIEGKKTLLHYYLLKRCSATERQRLVTIFGNSAATGRDIAYVQNLVRTYKLPAALEQEINQLRIPALTAINKLAVTKEARIELLALLDYCAQRQA